MRASLPVLVGALSIVAAVSLAPSVAAGRDRPAAGRDRPEAPGATALASPLAPIANDATDQTVADASSSLATRKASPLDRATRHTLDRILRDTVRKEGIAGLSVAVRSANGAIWTGVAGHAEFSPSRTIKPDTVFSIASVSKTFVAALILQLADEGKLSLDDPFGDYAPAIPGGKSVTIRQLLSHTSGIYDYFENPRYLRISGAWFDQPDSTGLASRDHRWTFDEIMMLVRSPYCRPGRCYHYSNTNYVILGAVASAAGGAPLPVLLRDRFFDPLGMTHTVYQPVELPPERCRARPLVAARRRAHRPHERRDRHPVHGGGERGQRRRIGRLHGRRPGHLGGCPLWRRGVVQALAAGDGDDPARGHVRARDRRGDVRGPSGYGHRGGLRGFEASMWYFPKERVSVALLSNQGNWFTDEPMKRIVQAVLGPAQARRSGSPRAHPRS